MLLLKREIDETIGIDDDIKITVMEIQNGQEATVMQPSLKLQVSMTLTPFV